jgi:hypothetical protein
VSYIPLEEKLASFRKFDSGATRTQDVTKPDYEGFCSPLVKKRFGAYMHKHRQTKDGTLRASDNWQLGIPRQEYIKSADRHFTDWHLHHRGYSDEAVEELEDSLCALMFNIQGYLHELLKEKRNAGATEDIVGTAGSVETNKR